MELGQPNEIRYYSLFTAGASIDPRVTPSLVDSLEGRGFKEFTGQGAYARYSHEKQAPLPQLGLPREVQVTLDSAVDQALHDVSAVDVDGDEGDDLRARFLG